MTILRILAFLVFLTLCIKIYIYIWLIYSSDRNKKLLKDLVKSQKFDICNFTRSLRLSVQKTSMIENGTKINHYEFYRNTKLFEVHGPIQALDAMYYESGIVNYLDCELQESVISFDGIKINSINNLLMVMGLDTNYVIVPKKMITERFDIMDILHSFCWENKICFSNEVLWQASYTIDKQFALRQMEKVMQDYFIVKGDSIQYTFLPLRYQSYFKWYQTQLNIQNN